MDISIVIPLYNEEESLPELIEWIERVMNENKLSFETILIDDGSTDNSWNIIEKLHSLNERIHGISFRRNYGKSAALYCGFNAAKGDVVITMDADLQDSPDEIPELYKMIKDDGYDLVSGWKKKRYDSKLSKNIPSKFFNRITRMMSGIKLHDFNCGLKAYKSKVIKSIEVYGEMHRYIPVLAKQAGFKRIGEKIVLHRARKYGTTKFGMSRFVNGFLDLATITFITKFGKKPMHFFGVVGTLMFLLGGVIAIWLIVRKLYCIANFIDFRDITSQPLFYIAMVTIIIGVQLFLAGFLGELISRNSNERNKYFIDKEI
ncbi:MAG: glycosyltransferase family 2 protein [Prevotellaceae bacterium]|jgi:glycosyltransferase involved in cell wall biosynthesis|nr:glycosyltransferase family 2 protein [Prevotellaceae bacterium]